MRYSVVLDEKEHFIDIDKTDQQWVIAVDERSIVVNSAQINAGHISLLIDGYSYDLRVHPVLVDGGATDTLTFEVVMDGVPRVVELVDQRRHALSGMAKGRHGGGDAQIKAPMPGLVVNVLVTAGDSVEHNQRVVVLEAMKMQNDLLTPKAGIVKAVKAEKGQAVNQGQVLVIVGDPAGVEILEEDPEE